MTSDLHLGDCLDILPSIPDTSIDMILADLPYGTTKNKWDSVMDLDKLWDLYRKKRKPGAAVVLFSQQPFTTILGASNLKELKTECIWEKPQGTGFLNARRYPLKSHENILVFCDRRPPYYPQMSYGGKPYKVTKVSTSPNYNSFRDTPRINTEGSRFPKTVLQFPTEKGLHPTQKPVALLEYLIKTYTKPGDVILDNVMGSGSTGVAALNTGRRFLGIEKDPTYYEIAKKRINETLSPVSE